ncbi:MAG: hypothetical protein IT286_05180 [Proteobacteria bacterium]|jgi:hypothetical protein|nr:hypothetical protein [Pseudomonadota bacterium]
MNQLNIRNSKNGIAIVLIMIILVVATGVGIWGLTSSRSSLLKAGSRKFSTELTYQAEQGLQKAVRRIQTITTGMDTVATINGSDTSPGKTDGNYTQKTTAFLLGLCPESSCSSPNPACSDYDPLKKFDSVDTNVVCNFLGVVDKSTQVSIVRKNNLSTGGETFAVFLVNSIATDEAGRKQAIQGVVVFPFSGTDASGTPYLASSKAVTD